MNMWPLDKLEVSELPANLVSCELFINWVPLTLRNKDLIDIIFFKMNEGLPTEREFGLICFALVGKSTPNGGGFLDAEFTLI